MYKLLTFLVRRLSRFESNTLKKGLLEYYLLSEQVAESNKITHGSEDGRHSLEFWFKVQQYADIQINLACNAYYDGKHPKHYFWVGHNQYLYDNVKTGDRVLDIGCGSSYYQQWIAEKAALVVGVDVLEDRIEKARRNNQKQNVHFECMDITSDFPSGQFDVVICSHVLEHIENPVLMLSALAKKVPRLLVKVPLEDSHWMKLVKRDIGMSWLDDADHRREYTIDLLKNS